MVPVVVASAGQCPHGCVPRVEHGVTMGDEVVYLQPLFQSADAYVQPLYAELHHQLLGDGTSGHYDVRPPLPESGYGVAFLQVLAPDVLHQG